MSTINMQYPSAFEILKPVLFGLNYGGYICRVGSNEKLGIVEREPFRRYYNTFTVLPQR